MVKPVYRQTAHRGERGWDLTRGVRGVWCCSLLGALYKIIDLLFINSAFQTFSGFSSGVGVRYEPSLIVHAQHQSCASKLIVGERMIPHVFVQAADVRPVNIHDVLPSDTRFKVLVFAGNIARTEFKAKLDALAEQLDAPGAFLRRFGQGDYREVFDILCVCAASKEDVDYTGKGESGVSHCLIVVPSEKFTAADVVITDIPKVLRPHWSKYASLM